MEQGNHPVAETEGPTSPQLNSSGGVLVAAEVEMLMWDQVAGYRGRSHVRLHPPMRVSLTNIVHQRSCVSPTAHPFRYGVFPISGGTLNRTSALRARSTNSWMTMSGFSAAMILLIVSAFSQWLR